MTTVFGTGDYRYQLIEDWPDWPINGVASDVVTDSSGNVFVAVRTLQTPEQNTGTILIFDDKGNFLDRFGDEYFATPHGLWINPRDEIWFADSGNHAVRKFDASGKLMMTLGTPTNWVPMELHLDPLLEPLNPMMEIFLFRMVTGKTKCIGLIPMAPI